MRLKALIIAAMLAAPMVGYAQDTPTPPAAATATAPDEAAPTEAAKPVPDGSVDVPVTMTTEEGKEALPEVDTEDPGQMVGLLIEAFKAGKWAWAVSLILMLLTWLLNRFLKNAIPKKVVPWVAIGLGVGSNIAMSLATGLKWYEAIGSGFTLGLAAIGGWEAIGKMFKKTDPKPA